MLKILLIIVVFIMSFVHVSDSSKYYRFYKTTKGKTYEITSEEFFNNWNEDDGDFYMSPDGIYHSKEYKKPMKALLIALLISVIPTLLIVYPQISKFLTPKDLLP